MTLGTLQKFLRTHKPVGLSWLLEGLETNKQRGEDTWKTYLWEELWGGKNLWFKYKCEAGVIRLMPKGLSQQTSARLLFGSAQHPKLMGRTSRKDNPDLIYTYIWNVIYAFYAVCFHENMVIFCIWLLVPKGMRRNIQIVYKMKKKKKTKPPNGQCTCR